TGRPVARYDNGTELLGLYHHRGAERSITVYFTGAPFKGHAKFAINSRVDAAPRLSTLAFDRTELDLAFPPPIPTELWQTGHIYSVKVPYRKRPGTERFYGSFVRLDAKPAPVRVGGSAAIDLIRL
ncbi:MAG: hypothetical protein QOI66_3907, partial [Myxococcales bacterium]|nr:hypothetical protein [Myxococcales bacterium]